MDSEPYRRVVDSMWLGYMASHKYFNYTGLINTPSLVQSEDFLCEEDIGLATYSVALHCCIPHCDAIKSF